jgi:hypothetical protein
VPYVTREKLEVTARVGEQIGQAKGHVWLREVLVAHRYVFRAERQEILAWTTKQLLSLSGDIEAHRSIEAIRIEASRSQEAYQGIGVEGVRNSYEQKPTSRPSQADISGYGTMHWPQLRVCIASVHACRDGDNSYGQISADREILKRLR